MKFGFQPNDRVSLFHPEYGVTNGTISLGSVSNIMTHRQGRLYAVNIDGRNVIDWIDEDDVAAIGSEGHAALAERHINDLKSARQDLVDKVEDIDRHIEQVEEHKGQIEDM
jgi:hypothetical protein